MQISIDLPHTNNPAAAQIPHVGYKTGGKKKRWKNSRAYFSWWNYLPSAQRQIVTRGKNDINNTNGTGSSKKRSYGKFWLNWKRKI